MGVDVVQLEESRRSILHVIFFCFITDPAIMAEAQAACRSGIEEASVVAAALESGARASSHGQHEVALAAAVRVMGVAPHCIVAQEMRVSVRVLLGS